MKKIILILLIFTLSIACQILPGSARPERDQKPEIPAPSTRKEPDFCEPKKDNNNDPNNSCATVTPLPNLVVTETEKKNSKNIAFHINFISEEKGFCSTDVKCDVAYVPRSVLYIRGDITIQANGNATGSGTMYFLDASECKTLDPSISSCSVSEPKNGAFTISGKKQGADKLAITIKRTQGPMLNRIMKIQHPSGLISLSMDGPASLVDTVLKDAGFYDKEFVISTSVSATKSELDFSADHQGTKNEGSGPNYSIHGLGGLFVIPVEQTLPEKMKVAQQQ